MEGNGYNPMKIEFEKLVEENKIEPLSTEI